MVQHYPRGQPSDFEACSQSYLDDDDDPMPDQDRSYTYEEVQKLAGELASNQNGAAFYDYAPPPQGYLWICHDGQVKTSDFSRMRVLFLQYADKMT